MALVDALHASAPSAPATSTGTPTATATAREARQRDRTCTPIGSGRAGRRGADELRCEVEVAGRLPLAVDVGEHPRHVAGRQADDLGHALGRQSVVPRVEAE